MLKKMLLIGLFPILIFILVSCTPSNGNGEPSENSNLEDQPQSEDPESAEEDGNDLSTEAFMVQARFIGLADANSAEFEIIESEEYHFEQELNVFRFGEDVITDFNEGVYEAEEIVILIITIEQGVDYNIYTIQQAQPDN